MLSIRCSPWLVFALVGCIEVKPTASTTAAIKIRVVENAEPRSGIEVSAHGPGLATPFAHGRTDENGKFEFELAEAGPVVLRVAYPMGIGLLVYADSEEQIELAKAPGGQWHTNSPTATLIPLSVAEGRMERLLEEVDDRAEASRKQGIAWAQDPSMVAWVEQQFEAMAHESDRDLAFLLRAKFLCVVSVYVGVERAFDGLESLTLTDWRWSLIEPEPFRCLGNSPKVLELRKRLAEHPSGVVRAHMAYLDLEDADWAGDDERSRRALALLNSEPMRGTEVAKKATASLNPDRPFRLLRPLLAFDLHVLESESRPGRDLTSSSLAGRPFLLHVASLEQPGAYQSSYYLEADLFALHVFHASANGLAIPRTPEAARELERIPEPTIEMISIFVDDPEVVRELRERWPMPWIVGTNPTLLDDWGISAGTLPRVFIVDAQGRLRADWLLDGHDIAAILKPPHGLDGARGSQ